MTMLELAEGQMQELRCSFPPYYVAAETPAGWPVAALSGALYEMLERGLAPSAGECQMKLINLRQKLRWSRSMMAPYYGVSKDVLRRWEDGSRKPSGAARRLIWLLDLLAREPDALKTAMDVIVWGRGKELQKIHEQLTSQV